MKGITAFALNNSRTVIMTLLLVIVGGIFAFIRLPKLEDPSMPIRVPNTIPPQIIPKLYISGDRAGMKNFSFAN